MDELTGTVERITYYNPENGYSVLRLRPEASQRAPGQSLSKDGLVTVVGNLPELAPGKHLRLRGRWDNHPQHGQQFKAEFCEQTLPAIDAQKRVKEIMVFLHARGVSTNLAVKIYKFYGDVALEAVRRNPYQIECD